MVSPAVYLRKSVRMFQEGLHVFGTSMEEGKNGVIM